MASIRIPKQHHNGLAKALSLPEDVFQSLIVALKSSPISFNLRENLKKAAKSIDGISSPDAKSIGDALGSIYIARGTIDLSGPEFISGVVQAINESSSDELLALAESSESIQSRLTQLFEIEPLLLVAKAGNVMLEHQSVYSKARVLTDMRPVFGETPQSTQAMMIIHNLKIHYHQDDQHRDFYVALDVQDIQKLLDTLQRAQLKANVLKAILLKTDIPYMEPEE